MNLKKKTLEKTISIFAAAALLMGCAGGEQDAKTGHANDPGVVHVYTHRHYESDQNIFQLFEEQTGIEVRVTNSSADELIQKMKMEGAQSPADVLITVDAGRLSRAKDQDLLQPISSATLEEEIPEHLRDEDNTWFGLTKRARIIAYAKDRVDESELSTYEDLATDKWKGRLLIRSSSNIYNQSLLASIVAHSGENKARDWAKGIVANMARAPKGSDRDQVKAVVAGEGDLTVVNSYYIGRMLNSSDPEEVATARKVGLFFPNQEGRGTHVNVSGAGVAKYAPNRENAIRFIEFLISEDAQRIFTNNNYEYPVRESVTAVQTIRDWGEFAEDDLPLTELGENNKKAVLIFDEVGWK